MPDTLFFILSYLGGGGFIIGFFAKFTILYDRLPAKYMNAICHLIYFTYEYLVNITNWMSKSIILPSSQISTNSGSFLLCRSHTQLNNLAHAFYKSTYVIHNLLYSCILSFPTVRDRICSRSCFSQRESKVGLRDQCRHLPDLTDSTAAYTVMRSAYPVVNDCNRNVLSGLQAFWWSVARCLLVLLLRNTSFFIFKTMSLWKSTRGPEMTDLLKA